MVCILGIAEDTDKRRKPGAGDKAWIYREGCNSCVLERLPSLPPKLPPIIWYGFVSNSTSSQAIDYKESRPSRHFGTRSVSHYCACILGYSHAHACRQ